ncbi:S8 family serine peptidase, partial [candidate division GN15 bacterium]|nr:S8 family serine peptidase [candidate division GN15 bacterium]
MTVHMHARALRAFLWAALTVSLALPAQIGLASTAPTADRTGPVPGQFVVKLSPGTKTSAVAATLAHGDRLLPMTSVQPRLSLAGAATWDRTFVISTADTTRTIEEIAEAIGRDRIDYIEPDYYLEFFDFPSDPLFSQQWYLYNTGQAYSAVDRIPGDFNDTLTTRSGTPGIDMGLVDFYQSPPAERTKVVVAIVDSGIDIIHPELQGQFWRNPDEIAGNGVDDDHNGLVDDTLGYDVSGDVLSLLDPIGDNDPTDSVGHGTHVAGLVGAAENGIGIAGSAPNAEIMAVKIRPNATNAVGAAGIVYAVTSGADIINVSWGSPYESAVLEDAISFARANDVLVCIAAGNSGNSDLFYPAAFDSAFTVAASNSDGRVAYFSTYGPHIDVVAPGLDILSLRASGTDLYASIQEPGVHTIGPDSLYYLASGTSMATPLVCGAAARLLATRPDLTVSQLESILKLGAVDIVDPFGLGDFLPGPDSISGYGRVDVSASLALVPAGGLYFVSPNAGRRYTSAIDIKAAAAGSYSGGWTLAYATADQPDNWVLIDTDTFLPADSVLATFAPPGLNGPVTLRLTDDAGVHQLLTITVVSEQALALTSPLPDSEYTYNIPIKGSAHGAQFDSLAVYYRFQSGSLTPLYGTTGEVFDTLLYSWNASGIDLGDYSVHLHGYFGGDTLRDSVSFTLASAFAAGWPQTLTGRGGLSAVSADLEGDGQKEIIVATTFGLNVFHADGSPMVGYPVLPEEEVLGLPAVYDLDDDGEQEIIFTTASGLHVVNHDGSYAEGWPVSGATGRNGFGYPVATVTLFNASEDSAITYVDRTGQVHA